MKTDATLFYWQDAPGGVLVRHDVQEHDYMCSGVMLAAQVLAGGQAILVARDDAAETVGELALRGKVARVQVAGVADAQEVAA